MSKDPAFLFYSSDFLTGTMFLSDEQVGKYIRLLCVQHQKGRLTEKHMINICKTYDKDVFDMFKKDENGLFYNERLEFEHNKRRAYSESRRKNRINSIKPLNISKTYVNHMENENENENRNRIKVEIYPTFEDFWILYDKKVGSKKSIQSKWNKLPQKTKEQIINYLPSYIQATPDKAYRKNPQTFLNAEAWKDEIINKNYDSSKETQNRYSNLERQIVKDLQS